MRWTLDAVCHKWPQKWEYSKQQICYDDALAHSALCLRQFLSKHGISQVGQPPYSPNMATCDFFFSLNLINP